jgi:tRNA nucleotidyltransferase (CCA-adding enzyme)
MARMETYLVGGAVRDELLGRPVTERDWVVVGATPQQMIDAGYRPVGRDFPVFLHPATGEEHALARTERKTGPGYRGFVVHAAPDVSLEDDLRRRDLTINAMARAADGTLIDPWGGRGDLERRLLRHVSPAFVEDPVRILRVARFAARFADAGFAVAPETMTLMREMVAAGEADALVAERVWQETRSALAEDRPQVFIETLRACGALARVYPELDRLFGVPQPPRWHPERDCGVHLLLCLAQAAELSDEPRVRFAVMLHDVGKGTTPAEMLPSHRGHEERGVSLIRELCRRVRVPKDYRELAVLVARHHGHCHRAHTRPAEDVFELLQSVDAFRRPDRFEEFLLACEADFRGRTGFETLPYPQGDLLRRALAAAARIKPDTASGLPGVEVGERLRDERLEAVRAALDEVSR